MRFRDQRFPCDVELPVACAGAVRRVQVVNVSVTGARVEGLGPVPQGARMILCRLDGRHPGVVVWANARQAGLRFSPELSPAQVDALRGVVGGDRAGGHGAGGARIAASHGFRELG